MFGVKFNSNDPDLDPLAALPEAETIIVEPADLENAYRRRAAIEDTVGGYTLVVKRQNHRKANSQMWWLGPHGFFLKTKYSLATDCGTVFARTATIHLIRRLDAEENLHAVTGFQRIMTSEMQGDGNWELCHRPFEFLLRMVQRFEFEVRPVLEVSPSTSTRANNLTPFFLFVCTLGGSRQFQIHLRLDWLHARHSRSLWALSLQCHGIAS